MKYKWMRRRCHVSSLESSGGSSASPLPATRLADIPGRARQSRVKHRVDRHRCVAGTNDIAQAIGTDSTAVAGGTSSTGPGFFDVAVAGGPGSTAVAGASPTTSGSIDSAVAIGNMLNATVTGVSYGVNIVTPFFNFYWLPLSSVGLQEVIRKCGGLISDRSAVHKNGLTR